MNIINKAYKKQQQQKDQQQASQPTDHLNSLEFQSLSLSGLYGSLIKKGQLAIVGGVLVVLLAISALTNSGYINHLFLSFTDKQNQEQTTVKTSSGDLIQNFQAKQQLASNANLTSAAESHNHSKLRAATVTSNNNKVVLSIQFSQLPPYRIDQNDGKLEVTFLQTNADKTQVLDKDHWFKNINMTQDNNHLKLQLALGNDMALDNIDSDKRSLTMIFTKPQTLKAQKLSTHEKATKTIKRAKEHINKHDYAQAANELTRGLAYEPNNVQAQKLLATVYLEQGELAKSMDLIDKGLHSGRDTSGFSLLKAYVLIQQHKVDKALEVLEKDQPTPVQDNLNYYALMANLHLRKKHYKQACKLYKDLLQYDANSGRWWIGLAIAYEKLKQRHSAKLAYKKALQDVNLPPSLRGFASKRAKSHHQPKLTD